MPNNLLRFRNYALAPTMNKSCALANYDARGFITFTTYCDPRNDANGGRASAEIRRVSALDAPGGSSCRGWEKKLQERPSTFFNPARPPARSRFSRTPRWVTQVSPG